MQLLQLLLKRGWLQGILSLLRMQYQTSLNLIGTGKLWQDNPQVLLTYK